MISAAIHGFLLSFGLILPLGVQNVFVFNQGVLQKRFANVLPVVITASICDTLLILSAVLGVSLLILGHPLFKFILMAVGALFLSYMGWITWHNKPIKPGEEDTALTPRRQIIFAVSVSLLNPHAIIDTVGVLGTSSLNYNGLNKLAFTSATITVSWLWFISLAMVGRITGKLDNTGIFVKIINKFSAIIIWSAAIYIGYSLFSL